MNNLSGNMQALEIMFEVLHNTLKTETEEVKQMELASWQQESVYTGLPNDGQSPRHWNTGLVSSGVILTSWREGASLALVGHLLVIVSQLKYLMG